MSLEVLMNELTDEEILKLARDGIKQTEQYSEEIGNVAVYGLFGRSLIGLAVSANATELDFQYEGLTHNGKPMGDWTIAVRRTDVQHEVQE